MRRRELVIASFTALMVILILIFGFSTAIRVIRLEELWRDYNQHATQESYVLNQIKTQMGYGGFIHNFKNYILRQEPRYIPLLEQNKQSLYRSIQDLQQLDLTEPEQEALAGFRKTIDEYVENFELAQELVAAGYSSPEIDARIRVDDGPALEALAYLADTAVEQSTLKERETSQALSRTLRFLLLGTLSIPFIILAGGVIITFMRRTIRDSAELQHSEERYRSLVGQLNSVVYRCENDTDWTMRYISEAVETISGYPATDFIQNRVRTFASIIHPEDTEAVEKTVDRALERGRPWSMDYRIVHRDGTIRWVYEKGSGVYEDGQLLYLSGVIDDITSRHQAEEVIEESERRYRQLVEEAVDVVFTSNLEGYFSYVNPPALKLTGYPEAELLKMRFTELIVPEWRDKVLDFYIHQHQERIRQTSFEFPIQTKSGEIKWVDQTVTLLFEHDEPVGYQSIVRDITDRKVVEDSLRKSEARLTEAYRIANLGSWEWDIKSDKTFLSDGFLAIIDRSSTEGWSFNSFLQIVHPDDQERFTKAVEHTLATHTSLNEEFRIVRPNGDVCVIHTMGALSLDDAGDPVRMVGTTQDISERKRAEVAIRDSNRVLASISRVQSEFIADVEPRKVFDDLLEVLLEITESEYGFIGEVLYTEDGAPYLKTWSITNIAWNEEMQKFYEEHAPNGMEFRNLKTLFGEVMITGEPVIANEPATDPRRGGLPEGHPALDAFLGMPLHSGQELVGMAGVANRAGGYNQQLLGMLQPLLMTASNLMVAWRNIRLREAAEKALGESETRLRAIVDTAAEAIIVIDSKGIIENFNRGAELVFGYSTDDVIGRSVNLLMPESDGRHHDEYIRRYIKTGIRNVIGTSREVTARRKDGSLFPIQLAVSEVALDDRLLFAGIVHDITERVEAEAQRSEYAQKLELQNLALAEAIKEAEAATLAKSEFLAKMSH
ncbi:MAG: PAS domain S-box protein, partial [Fidelibacterota bacterium]